MLIDSARALLASFCFRVTTNMSMKQRDDRSSPARCSWSPQCCRHGMCTSLRLAQKGFLWRPFSPLLVALSPTRQGRCLRFLRCGKPKDWRGVGTVSRRCHRDYFFLQEEYRHYYTSRHWPLRRLAMPQHCAHQVSLRCHINLYNLCPEILFYFNLEYPGAKSLPVLDSGAWPPQKKIKKKLGAILNHLFSAQNKFFFWGPSQQDAKITLS